MCVENIEIAAAAGQSTTTTKAATGPVLNVDDPRFDDFETGDPVMQRRRKVLAVLGRLFPMAWKRTLGKDNPCELEQGNYKEMLCWTDAAQRAGTDSCSSVNAAIMTAAGLGGLMAFDVERRIGAGWVPYQPGSGKLPSVGDTYLLKRDLASAEVYHSGIVCQVSLEKREFWICADGGQTYENPNLPPVDYSVDPPRKHPDQANQSAQLVPRTLICENPGQSERAVLHRFDSNKMRFLYGWLDLGHPKVTMTGGGAFDAAYTKAHYEAFRDMIRTVDKAVKKKVEPSWIEEDNAAVKAGTYAPVGI